MAFYAFIVFKFSIHLAIKSRNKIQLFISWLVINEQSE